MGKPIRILVADDFEDWRHQIRGLLQMRPEWQIISEVSNGLEAVLKAEELKPDLVLLDIGLPVLNGIEAARRIRQSSPNCRIVFVSLDNSLAVVQVALDTGADGYVYKARARSELLPAIDAALKGNQFVTRMIRGFRFADATTPKAPNFHEVQFYPTDSVFLDGSARFVAAALKAGDVAVSITTGLHHDGLVERLQAQGVDVHAATQQGTYIPLDASKTLSTFVVNDQPDASLFFEVMGNLMERAAKAGSTEHPRIATCRESGALLLAEGRARAAIYLEELWAKLATTYEVDILCGYPLSSFQGEEGRHIFQNLCAEHSAIYSR